MQKKKRKKTIERKRKNAEEVKNTIERKGKIAEGKRKDGKEGQT